MANISPEVKRRLIATIDAVGELQGLGIVVNVEGTAQIIREPMVCSVVGDYVVVDIEIAQAAPRRDYGQAAREGGLAAINCTAAVIAGLVTFGSAAASPFSGGTSLAVTTIGYAATAATGASCAVSAIRTYNALTDPSANEALDNSPAYQTTMTVIDGVSLLGVGASAAATVKVMGIMSRAGVSLRAARTGGLSRQARARLAREATRANRPGISNGELKGLIRSGQAPKRFPKQTISAGTVHALRDSVAAGLSFLASAFDGNVQSLVVYIVHLEND